MNGVIEDHLQSIEDFVLVEDKIVTYKWVSKVLKVHVNTAKQLLHAFTLKEHFNKKLLVTYLISGKGKNDSGVKYCLVKEEDVDKVKLSLEKVLSQHVYSIQRDSNFDAKILYNADYVYELDEEDKKFCSIQKNDDIVKRYRLGEVSTVSSNNSIAEKSKVTEKEAISSVSEKKEDARKNKNFSEPKPTKSCSENTAKTKQCISPIKDSTKGSPTNETTKSPTKTGTLKNKKAAKVQSKGPSIGTFFSKQTANAKSKKEVSVPVVEKEKEESKENIGKVINQSSENCKIQLENDDLKQTLPPKKKENSKKRKKRDKDYESSSKRRKRIVVMSESESSCNETDNEEEREPTPEPEPEPVQPVPESDEEIIPPTPVQKGRKRIRKQIDRTFKDEDGFVLTKKEYVYESCSDDDELPSATEVTSDVTKVETSNKMETGNSNKNLKEGPKVENNKNKKMKKSPKKTPPKNKQASIMNFFKRK